MDPFGSSDYTDNYEQLLKAMGFNDENEIKQALTLSNNDINEAVAILTNEKLPKITTLVPTNQSPSSKSNKDVIASDEQIDVDATNIGGEENPLEFPVSLLYQLENSVFTDNWSIPYKREEALGRLLVSTTALIKEGLAESDANCKRFLDRVIPEVYKKLLDSMPVNKWNTEVQQGVYNMCCMCVEMIAVRLNQPGEVPEVLLNTLTLAFTSENTFHVKNMHKTWDKAYFVEKLGAYNLFTINIDTNGWLLNFINTFGFHKGFDGIKAQLEKSNDLHDLNLLLKPLAACCSFLNRELLVRLLEESFRRILEIIKKLDKDDFKEKNVGRVFDLLISMKKLSLAFWPNELDNFHKLHLNVVLNMLKYHHFNSKMNSLKEICKLIENATASTIVKTNIKEEVLSEWIISQQILSLAVEGNIDQAQYCDKIKTIVEFIGDRIKNEEISALWNMQYNKPMPIIDNLYMIIGIAATKFSSEQLDYLLEQLIQTWNKASFKLHDKLVGLLRIIGREAKSNKICARILEALWELKNRAGLSRQLLLLIYAEHLSVLNGGRLPREAAKREYLKKCCEEIKRAPGSSVAIASLKHLYEISNSYSKNTSKALKDVLNEVVVPIMKYLCLSLVKCHSNAYEKADAAKQKFDQTALVDDVFSYEEVVQIHLNSMRFILKEGNLYLNLNRAQEIWDVLIAEERSCEWDRQTGYEWFIDCWPDLHDDSRTEIFNKQILKMQPAKLTLRGYECFKLYFIRVNEHENKMQIRSENEFSVEKLELTGLNYLWDIILYAHDERIADLATKFLLEISFEKVSQKLKREIVQLHKRFIDECYHRLENCLSSLDSSPIGQLLLNSFRITYGSVGLTECESVQVTARSSTIKCIERLLMIAERYIVTVEESSSITRTFLPHFVTFKSEAFPLVVNGENRQPCELFVCSNDTLGDLRGRIASSFSVSASNLQIYMNDKLINATNDARLLASLGIDGTQPLNVKFSCSYPPSLNLTPLKDPINFNYSRVDVDQEKSFPGVLIATGGFAFDMLYRLEDLEEASIKIRVRNILKLIPTNPKLIDAYDRIIGRLSTASSNNLATSSACAGATTSAAATASSLMSSSASNIHKPLKKSPSASSMTSSPSYSSVTISGTRTPPVASSSSPSTPTNPSSPATFSSTLTGSTKNTQLTSSNSTLANVTNSAMAAMSSFFSKRTDSTTSLDSKSLYMGSVNKDFGQFFESSLPLHRILYHLETLSSKLAPSSQDPDSLQPQVEQFQQDFLKANGLEVLVSLLKMDCGKAAGPVPNPSLASHEYETKQDIYLLLLQLIRSILFGSIYPLTSGAITSNASAMHGVNKRPSSEPMVTSCPKKIITNEQSIFSNDGNFNVDSMSFNAAITGLNAENLSSSTLNSGDSKYATILQKMSSSEVVELIVQLLVIFWSAAAGNLQLMNCDGPIVGVKATLNEGQSPVRVTRTPESSLSSLVGYSGSRSPNPTIEEASAQQITEAVSGASISQSAGGESEMNVSSAELPVVVSGVELMDQQPLEEPESSSDSNTRSVTINEPAKAQKEVTFFIQDHRLSTGSNMSTSSVDSSDTQLQYQFSPLPNTRLQSGVCIKQTHVSVKDVKIASKAIELITCFALNRKDCLSTLLSMKVFRECVIDVLTGSISSDIRTSIEKFLLKLCQIETPTFKCKDHLMSLVIKARLPLWSYSSVTRLPTQKLISQSAQYFNLRCALLENLTIEEQVAYSIDLRKMLGDEVNWIIYFSPTNVLKDIDNVLLTGHLCLTRSLLTCETATKTDVGAEIIPQLVQSYLFPASYLLSNPSDDSSMEPICSTEASRLAAYRLLVELSHNCIVNYKAIASQLIKFHHLTNPLMANEWNYIPLVTPRAQCGFVGLKNGGATCYMNAVLQQLFMIPGITDYLLRIEDDTDKKSVFYQLQNVFAHLKMSKLEYYVPESFWKAFKMWGMEVNVREQQDAFDFFISLTDQIDEHLKKIKKEPIFKKIFGGTFSNQFICKDCPHKYEREEAFLGLNLPIKAGNLQESLLQFVKDELLDGENSYYCEECGEKRSAIKRTCIKRLPKYVCVQLKRFDYDWESNRALKFDDYFQFPRRLDVSPYTYDSINRVRDQSISIAPNQPAAAPQPSTEQIAESIKILAENMDINENSNQTDIADLLQDGDCSKEVIYDLVGIVVHSGQANAGHYYSFIKGDKGNGFSNTSMDHESGETDRAGEEDALKCSLQDKHSSPSSPSGEKCEENWYKFNDTTVEEINLNETTLIEECFGGTFTQSSEYKLLPEERVRYWNGYMLLYKEVEVAKTAPSASKLVSGSLKHKQRREFGSVNTGSSGSTSSVERVPVKSSKILHDSLSELAELVSRGDEKGLFRTQLPASIDQAVKAENLEFCKNRGVYDPDYFQFIFNLVKIFKENCYGEESADIQIEFMVECCNLGLEFLFNTFFKTGKKLRNDLTKWMDLFKELLHSSKEAGNTMLNFFLSRENNSSFLRHYLLECPISEIRESCSSLFENCTNSLIVKHETQPSANQKLTALMNNYVQLLDKAVIDQCKNSSVYFRFLYIYANMSKETAHQLISLGLFGKLICFLLGNPGKADEAANRRWSTLQSREFAVVYETISSLVLRCNVMAFKTCEPPPNEPSAMPIPDADDELPELIEQYPTTSESSNYDYLQLPAHKQFVFVPPKASNELIPVTQEMQIYLFGVLSTRYLKELVFAFEQINHGALHRTLDMILSCCYCNEAFSANMIHQILMHINNSISEIKQVLILLNHIILIEDPLQLTRLRLALDGYKENDVVYNGLLSIVRQNQGSDAKKPYQCVKFIVALANKSGSCKEYLMKNASNWEWSVNWLKNKMRETSDNSSNFISLMGSKSQSNDDADTKTFQRTKSAQRTLDDATALLQSNDLDL